MRRSDIYQKQKCEVLTKSALKLIKSVSHFACLCVCVFVSGTQNHMDWKLLVKECISKLRTKPSQAS